MSLAEIYNMTYAQVEDAKARFRGAWNALRDNPLPLEAWREVRGTGGVVVACWLGGRLQRWVEWVDDLGSLDPSIARWLFSKRHHFQYDGKVRAVTFIDPDLDLFEIAVLEEGYPPKRPQIGACLPFRRDPSLSKEQQAQIETNSLKVCWEALRLELAKEAAGLRGPHPAGIQWPTIEQQGLQGDVLVIRPGEDGEPPSMCEEQRDDFEEWIGDDVMAFLPNDGKFRAVAFSDAGLSRWEVRVIGKNGRLGPIKSGSDPEPVPPPKLRLVSHDIN